MSLNKLINYFSTKHIFTVELRVLRFGIIIGVKLLYLLRTEILFCIICRVNMYRFYGISIRYVPEYLWATLYINKYKQKNPNGISNAYLHKLSISSGDLMN